MIAFLEKDGSGIIVAFFLIDESAAQHYKDILEVKDQEFGGPVSQRVEFAVGVYQGPKAKRQKIGQQKIGTSLF